MGFRVEDIPESERPRERLKHEGVESLTDVEILSLILRTGSKDKNVKQLASQIRKKYSFQELLNTSKKELEKFNGISEVKSGQLLAAAEMAKRTKKHDKNKLKNLKDAKKFFRDLKLLEKERLRVVFLNSGNGVLGTEKYQGSVSAISVRISSIFNEAIKRNSAAILVGHNHPSGKAKPTDADKEFTRRTVQAGEALGIELLDHVIVGKDTYSFRRDSSIFKKELQT